MVPELGQEATALKMTPPGHPPRLPSGFQEVFISWAADVYLLKPTDLEELRGRIRGLLRQRRKKNLSLI
jgi:hypothetical protein